jgi:hypothetical protein
MKAAVILCASCRHSWQLSFNDSLYLQLDLSSRPCPHCEAYTLGCHAAREGESPPRSFRSRRTAALVQPAPG